MKIRTRIAPSPTGYPHIGTIYQSLFDYVFAKKNNGHFIIRIEDTDRERFVPDAEEKLYNALDWVNLTEDESPRKDGPYKPYRQSERLEIYQKYALELLEKDHAYYCFCTKDRLDELRNTLQQEKQIIMYDKHCRSLSQNEVEEKLKQQTPHVIRMKIPEDTTIVCEDLIRGKILFDSKIVDDQVIIKSDGFPTYHLAAVIDDHLMEITHVLRGEEWLPSLPKHWLLYEFFNWQPPYFYHMATLRNPDKSKLSKRQGHTNISWYQEEGYLADAIINFLALLGWTHPDEKEIFAISEFIEKFDFANIHKAGPIFDLTKLKWMNQQYIMMKSDEELKNAIKNFYPPANKLSEEILHKLIPLVKSRMETLKDFDALTTMFYTSPLPTHDEKEKSITQHLLTELEKIDDWNKETIFRVFKTLLLQYKIRMPYFYTLLTGKENGLPLPETLEIFGKENTVDRLKHKLI
jgi:glutamyl-tRNA synthetase